MNFTTLLFIFRKYIPLAKWETSIDIPLPPSKGEFVVAGEIPPSRGDRGVFSEGLGEVKTHCPTTLKICTGESLFAPTPIIRN
jgi:hypothetical protein